MYPATSPDALPLARGTWGELPPPPFAPRDGAMRSPIPRLSFSLGSTLSAHITAFYIHRVVRSARLCVDIGSSSNAGRWAITGSLECACPALSVYSEEGCFHFPRRAQPVKWLFCVRRDILSL